MEDSKEICISICDELSRDDIATKLDAIQSEFDAIYERLARLEEEERKRRNNAQENLNFMRGWKAR